MSPREVGGGRATRQPGQVRKEAALTSAARVIVPASHLIFISGLCFQHGPCHARSRATGKLATR